MSFINKVPSSSVATGNFSDLKWIEEMLGYLGYRGIPTFEIINNPTVNNISSISARRFYTIDHAQINAKNQIQKEEDEAIFNAINSITSNA